LTPLLGAGICVAIQFGALESAKRYFGGGQLSAWELYLSGAFAGFSNSVISGPMEHVRIRLQVQSGNDGYKGPKDFISKTFKQYGFAGLYKGQGVTLLREGHGYGVYFALYEYLTQKHMRDNNLSRKDVSTMVQLINGSTTGIVLWAATYPIDIVKSKLQTDSLDKSKREFSSAIDCVKKTFKSQGLKGFYKGFSACILRAGPANGATFVAYEVVMNLIGR
jgi:solute carrier family 25 carnitine/acylcarnitine transporter 20/29